MTTSATQDFLSEVVKGERIPAGKLAYFEARFSGLVHQAMLKIFGRLEESRGLTRRQLSLRIGRKPEQITRWFSYPTNLTLSSVSNIFLGLGYEVERVVLTDLATGERVYVPDQAPDIFGVRLPARSSDDNSREAQRPSAIAAVAEARMGRAELAAQMEPHARTPRTAEARYSEAMTS